MPNSAVFTFTDPHPYQATIRAAQVQIFPIAKGEFRAELTHIDLPRLWMQRSSESLPRVSHAAMSAERAAFFFLADAQQAAMHHSGMDLAPREIVVYRSRATHHHRTVAPCRWASMSLTLQALADAGHSLAGRDLTAPAVTHITRPPPALMARLLRLHAAAGRLARTAPEVLANRQVARALDQALVHALIGCLTEGAPIKIGSGAHHHVAIIARLEEFLAQNHDRAVYLAEICAATGASERTLRVCCQEHLGMGPLRYLWLRRMYLAHRALILANPATTTVTEIAAEYGFWELGRFSVEYRTLFGEPPSVSLRRPPDDRPMSPSDPFAWLPNLHSVRSAPAKY